MRTVYSNVNITVIHTLILLQSVGLTFTSAFTKSIANPFLCLQMNARWGN